MRRLPPLTDRERNVWRTLQTLLLLDDKETFSSDDLRMYQLDRFFENPQQDIGTFFAKLKQHKHAKTTGQYTRSQLESNHNRKIQTWILREQENQT